ncbi:enoyl-CoA hydratase-related protein, partial [candidate division KSB1 bacterium]
MDYKDYQNILVEFENSTATLYLNRPGIHNAFDDVTISEMTDAFQRFGKDPDVKVIILAAKGPSFCAGADLNWMKRMGEVSYDDNFDDALRFFKMIFTIYSCDKPTIARIHGLSFGGGNGMISACDIAVAADNSEFSVSEIRVGLAPALISPFIMKKIGEGYSREFMLTSERFSAETAFRIGLINRIVPEDKLDEEVSNIIGKLKLMAPEALIKCKKMIRVNAGMDEKEIGTFHARLIADLRCTDEAREGIMAFLEK